MTIDLFHLITVSVEIPFSTRRYAKTEYPTLKSLKRNGMIYKYPAPIRSGIFQVNNDNRSKTFVNTKAFELLPPTSFYNIYMNTPFVFKYNDTLQKTAVLHGITSHF